MEILDDIPLNAEDFVTYAKFIRRQDALDLADFLKEKGVPYTLSSSMIHFDPSLSNNELNHEIELRLHPDQFEQVDLLRKEEAKKNALDDSEEHYLHNFTDQELIDVLSKPDEWNPFDVILAQHILDVRGISLDEDHLKKLQQQRLDELRQTEPSKTIWLLIGYVMASLGGIIGIMIGWHLYFHKKTLPNGERIYYYTPKSRMHGYIMGLLGSIALVIFVILRFLRETASFYVD